MARVVSEYISGARLLARLRPACGGERVSKNVGCGAGGVKVRRLAAARRQHCQYLFVRPARAVGADRLDADMIGAGVPMFLDALADRRLVAPGDIGVDEAVRAAAAEIVIAKAESPPIVDVIIEPHIGGERLAGSGTRLAGIAFKQDPDLGT